MGSPISFSGFNNIDFGVVLNAIMLQERAPIAAIEARRSTLQAQDTAFGTLATRLGALETAAAALATGEQLTQVTATSSDDTAVGISTGSATATGQYEVVVSELARAQVMVSNSSYASPDAVIATSGVISLAQFSHPPLDIVVSGAMTLEDLADEINSNPDAPVNASVVQVAPGEYRLVLTGRATGAANGFTVEFSTALSGGEGLTFIDTDGNGVSGDSAADNVQVANDASLTVNQVAITSASNDISDAVPGVTLHLRKADPASTVQVSVAKDDGAAVEQVETFVKAYNDFLSFLGEQTTAANGGKPAISRDPLVRGLRDALRSAIMQAEVGGAFSRLAEVGIGFDTGGQMTLDKEMLTKALDSSPADVRLLFGGADGDSGRFGAIKALVTSYTEAGGLVADVRDRIDDQVAQLGQRIDTLEAQLAIRREALQREFIAADRAMSQLNSQGSSLSQLAGQFRLF